MADEKKDQAVLPSGQPNINKNDEPPTFLAPGNVDLVPGGFEPHPTTVSPQTVVFADIKPLTLPDTLEREVTDEDMASPLWKKIGPGQQVQFPSLVLRPGDVVRASVEVMGLHDLKKRYLFLAGSEVPGDDSGYLPVNYVPERLLIEAVKVDREAVERARAEAEQTADEQRQAALAVPDEGARSEAATTRTAPRARAEPEAKDKK